MSIPLIIILVIVVVLVVAVIGLYNNLVKLRNMVDNAWAQIDVQLQRRLDLIPNLVETVKGYAAHESGTLEEVTKARTAVMNAPTPEGKMQADGFLTGVQVSQATRLIGSFSINASRMASEMASHILSGWPSVTDSDVNNLFSMFFSFYKTACNCERTGQLRLIYPGADPCAKAQPPVVIFLLRAVCNKKGPHKRTHIIHK